MTNSQLELLNAFLDARSMILSCIRQLHQNSNEPVYYVSTVNGTSQTLFSSEMSFPELCKKLKTYDYHIEALLRKIDISEVLKIPGR